MRRYQGFKKISFVRIWGTTLLVHGRRANQIGKRRRRTREMLKEDRKTKGVRHLLGQKRGNAQILTRPLTYSEKTEFSDSERRSMRKQRKLLVRIAVRTLNRGFGKRSRRDHLLQRLQSIFWIQLHVSWHQIFNILQCISTIIF